MARNPVRHTLLPVVAISLVALAASAKPVFRNRLEEPDRRAISVSHLPSIAYGGLAFRINVSGGKPTFEYRVIAKKPEQDWDLETAWSASPELSVTPMENGPLNVVVQVRDPETDDLIFDEYLGDVITHDHEKALQLISRPFARYQMKEVRSTLSSIASETAWRDGIRSPQDLVSFIRSHEQAANAETIAPSPSGRFALAALQIVSGLWHYGNVQDPLAPGCVAVNERLEKPLEKVTLDAYLASEIGCCVDYAAMLGLALKTAGIESRVVQLPTHVFNEAIINGEWWTLDANIGVAYQATWDKVIDGTTPINIFRFQSASIGLGSRIYSDGAADFQTIMLMQAAAGLQSTYSRVSVDDYIKRRIAPDQGA